MTVAKDWENRGRLVTCCCHRERAGNSLAKPASNSSAPNRRSCSCTAPLLMRAVSNTLIPLLQNDGYNVVAVQNPLLVPPGRHRLPTKRLNDAQKGPVVVVGHSYGGIVISGAASGKSQCEGARLPRCVRA